MYGTRENWRSPKPVNVRWQMAAMIGDDSMYGVEVWGQTWIMGMELSFENTLRN